MTTLFPESWITKYEILHQVIKPVQSNNPFFIRKENGEVETRFLVAPSKKKDVTVFPTQISMLHLVSYVYEDGLQINAFREDGKPCYEGKSPSGHIWWDICNCAECRKEETLEEDYSRRRKKKSTQQIFKERYEAGDPEVNLLGEPSRKFDQDFETRTVRSDQKNREPLSFAFFLASRTARWKNNRDPCELWSDRAVLRTMTGFWGSDGFFLL